MESCICQQVWLFNIYHHHHADTVQKISKKPQSSYFQKERIILELEGDLVVAMWELVSSLVEKGCQLHQIYSQNFLFQLKQHIKMMIYLCTNSS